LLVEQYVDRGLAREVEHELGSGFSEHGGGAVDKPTRLRADPKIDALFPFDDRRLRRKRSIDSANSPGGRHARNLASRIDNVNTSRAAALLRTHFGSGGMATNGR